MVRGKLVDDQTRCVHYHSALDIIAVKMKCCGEYYACILCHEELVHHAPLPWPKSERDSKAVLCGNCSAELSISEYLACGYQCPNCKSFFNPACEKHHALYFES